MSRYFDKDFFKLALGFIVIVALSLSVIIVAKLHEANSELEPSINIANP